MHCIAPAHAAPWWLQGLLVTSKPSFVCMFRPLRPVRGWRGGGLPEPCRRPGEHWLLLQCVLKISLTQATQHLIHLSIACKLAVSCQDHCLHHSGPPAHPPCRRPCMPTKLAATSMAARPGATARMPSCTRARTCCPACCLSTGSCCGRRVGALALDSMMDALDSIAGDVI